MVKGYKIQIVILICEKYFGAAWYIADPIPTHESNP